jgi:hypothetical protein
METLLDGFGPASPEYWGAVHDRDQRIVEASDIALGREGDPAGRGLPYFFRV